MWFKSATSSQSVSTISAAPGKRSVPSILSAGARIQGDIVSDGEVHILGSVAGNVTANKLTLGEGGSLSGTVETETATINGVLTGRLAAVNVVLGSNARVTADIIYVSMRIEPGAVFEGYSRRVESIETISGDAVQLPPPPQSTQATVVRHIEPVVEAEAGK
jgi:cytoskeletal protein CcmA (bactofilin family)